MYDDRLFFRYFPDSEKRKGIFICIYTKKKRVAFTKKNYKKDKCMYTFFVIIESYKILRIIFLEMKLEE